MPCSALLRLAAEAGDTCSVKILAQLLIERKLYEANLKEIYLAHKSARAEMESEDRQRSAARDKAMSGNDYVLKGLYTCYYVGYISAKQLKEVLEMHRNGSEVQEIRKFIANARNGKSNAKYAATTIMAESDKYKKVCFISHILIIILRIVLSLLLGGER